MSPIAKTFKTVASKVVKSRKIQLGYVETTDKWKRLKLDSKIQSQFNQAVENNADSLKANAVGVYMQETPHQSHNDHRNHFTAVQVDKDNKVIATNHFVVKKK